jgi:hypothetical protein
MPRPEVVRPCPRSLRSTRTSPCHGQWRWDMPLTEDPGRNEAHRKEARATCGPDAGVPADGRTTTTRSTVEAAILGCRAPAAGASSGPRNTTTDPQGPPPPNAAGPVTPRTVPERGPAPSRRASLSQRSSMQGSWNGRAAPRAVTCGVMGPTIPREPGREPARFTGHGTIRAVARQDMVERRDAWAALTRSGMRSPGG